MSGVLLAAGRAAACVAVGVASAVLGMLPWLARGGRLALQNLWASPVADPSAMPFVLLPFSQYQLGLVAGVVVVGAGVAGVAARMLARAGLRGTRRLVGAGVVAAQLAALVQTLGVVAPGLRHPGGVVRLVDDALAYLVLMSCWILLAILVGVGVFALIVSPARGSSRRAGGPDPDAPRSCAVVAAGLVAAALEPWLRCVVVPPDSALVDANAVGLQVAHWAPAVLIAAAIVWGGARPPRRLVAALGAVAVFWAASTMLDAVAATAGSRALLRLPDELIRSFALAVPLLARSSGLLEVVIGAVVLAAIGLAARLLITRMLRAAAV